MEPTLEQAAHAVIEHYRQLFNRLHTPAYAADPRSAARLASELKRLQPTAECAEHYLRLCQELRSLQELLQTESDPELRQLAEEELEQVEKQLEEATDKLRRALLPSDPDDSRNCIVEIRAGTGGEEAALFAADLFRIYQRYAERKGWKLELVDVSESDLGGFKEIIFTLSGDNVYGTMKYESGVHRVQRVPITESSGRIHTSAATVAVLPEPEEVEVELRNEDLRIDVFRASGHGGQNVNKVETAVRIRHIPTGIVVTCQQERSQHQNRERALKILRAKLYQKKLEEQAAVRAALEKSKRKIEWGSQIRSYVLHPYLMVADHRTGLKTSDAYAVLDGDLDAFIKAYLLAQASERRTQAQEEKKSS